MKIITCAGYYGTGSSAITDLMKEYDNVTSKNDFEVNFIYDYHGINDLYHYLVESPIRTVSNEAIKDFIKYMERISKQGKIMNYEKYFNNHFMEYTNQYIEEICGDYFFKIYYSDFLDKGLIYKYIFKLLTKIYHKINKNTFKQLTGVSRKKYFMHTLDKDYFIEKTKKFFLKLFSEIDVKEFLMIDQLVSSSNIEKCTRYFDDIKVIVVDRDPRDIYLSEKYIWKGGYLPIDNVVEFCKWYRWTRELSTENDKKFLHIKFEDLIFHYNTTIDKIECYCGLSSKNHKFIKKKFDPELSINNCVLWEKYPNEAKNIDYIKNELKEYLYEK